MPDPKNITEGTTLAELREQRDLLGVTAIQLHRPAMNKGAVAATVHHASGFFMGAGSTDAEAIEAAFSKLRRALLPAPIKQYLGEEASDIECD